MDKSGRSPLEAAEHQAASRRPISIKRIRMSASELDQRARQVGAAAGGIVARLREARKKFNERDLWTLTNPFSDLRTSAKGYAQELRHASELRTQELRRAARETTSRLGRRLREEPGTTRAGRNYFLTVAAAAGLLGFLLGMGLKAWRSHGTQ